mmetsp:Transcript_22090/g.48034  ORF Transcript_22090/g.48034 Transcript_22090/m.48034 type:complete len:968 (-) Transcript_22090:25-2928(-)
MVWCNQPPCSNANCKGNEDGKQMKSKGVRGPETEEEKTGGASRVEVYTCKLCNTENTFPRFNSPRTLFKSRRGRCGEFANLFGAYCRALGFDTRYILDFTDHVWTEVWSVRQQRWLHADSCEGLIDRPNMYEQGWGKKLNYAIGATHDSVAETTKRYTRKFYSDEFQARRREFAPDENTSERVFLQMSGALGQMNSIKKGRLEELEKRGKAEEKFFGMVQSSGVWDAEYREGRISGSLAWKAARYELGDNKEKREGEEGKDDEQEFMHSFFVESFYPSSRHNDLTIVVQPQMPSSVPSATPKANPACVTVGGVPCAATLTNGISVVVVDEESGCILQSKAFSQLSSAGTFLDTVPDGRIVAVCCYREEEQDAATKDNKNKTIDASTSRNLSRLGGFNIDAASTSTSHCFLFVGQMHYYPHWATSLETSDNLQSIKVTLQLKTSSPPKARLRSEINTVPAVVSTRLPESIMPLKTQLTASNFQKRVAFNAYMENGSNNSSVIGYTTRPDAPVYLIDNQSFPFQRSGGQTCNLNANDASWVTHHFLPDPLVPDDDEVTEEANIVSSRTNVTPKFDIPIADDYFMGLLGNQLLVQNAMPIDTTSALANTRLVALYFSAQWCGPCRGFTPLLIEFYNHLKEVSPTHGLEIVFVSSDKDEGHFQQYYGKMPFLALPFSNRALAKHVNSVFGVRGIPSLVVIDSLSGRIVTSPDESKRDVHQACQRGEQAIERLLLNWLDKVPVESKSMLDILALSANSGVGSSTGKNTSISNAKAESYLMRKKLPADSKDREETKSNCLLSTEDSAARVKEIFSHLVATGLEPNAAAAEAIKRATSEQKKSSMTVKLEEGRFSGTGEMCALETVINTIEEVAEVMCQLNARDKAKVGNVLSTAKKYVTNVQKDPSNPRFRTFRLSNRIFDGITSTPGSIELLTNLGFTVFHSDVDFVASIPLWVDLDLMVNVFDNLLKTYSS